MKPHVGADMIFIPGYVREASSMAFGFRVRGGANFMVSDTFGFNANLTVGFWTGDDFNLVQSDLETSGMAPQLSGGTIFLF